jgi:type II secretory pathway pseudopilin PulG
MNDATILALIIVGFVWGYGTARLRDFLGRLDEERAEREANRSAYMRQRHVRIYGGEWGPDA